MWNVYGEKEGSLSEEVGLGLCWFGESSKMINGYIQMVVGNMGL